MCADYWGGPDGVVDVTMVCSDEHCGVRDLDDAVVARLITLISAHLERSFEPDHEEYGELLRVAAQIRYVLSSETETDICALGLMVSPIGLTAPNGPTGSRRSPVGCAHHYKTGLNVLRPRAMP